MQRFFKHKFDLWGVFVKNKNVILNFPPKYCSYLFVYQLYSEC